MAEKKRHRLQEEYEKFEEDHKQLKAELMQDLDLTLRPEPPKELFHYTSSAMEIVETNRLRATNLIYTNDYTELRHGHDLAQTLREELSANATSAIAKQFLKRRAQDALSFVSQKGEVFGFSLSESMDDLTQWRSYASNGTGHMIGFHPDRFEPEMEIAGDPNIQIMLLKVLYDEELQRKALKGLIQKVTSSVERDQSKYRSDYNLLWHGSLLAGRSAPYLVSAKRTPFLSEHEWRLVAIDYSFLQPAERSKTVKFRKSGSQIIPFVEFRPKDKHSLLPIQSIELGPQADSSLGPHATKLLLKENGYNVPVTKCDIPFRSF